jgi:hypothetical protein
VQPSGTSARTVGTTDVDVQVDLEIQSGSANAPRLERALQTSGFTPSDEYVWRWRDKSVAGSVVKIEFLADLEDERSQVTVRFDGCESLGAVNLRGTGFAARAWQLRTIEATVDEQLMTVEVRVAALPAYLLAKTHAAYARGEEKDWHDVAYVIRHNDDGGPAVAAGQVRAVFGADLVGSTSTALGELAANFTGPRDQGSVAYAKTMIELHPHLDFDLLANDAVAAVEMFIDGLQVDK